MPLSPQQTQEFVASLTGHQEVIRCYLISMLPTLTDVEDLQQEVNIFLWEKKEEFERGSNFKAWACSVAYYKVLDYRKKLKKDGVLIFNQALSEILHKEEAHSSEQISKKRNALHSCLQALHEKDRSLLLSRYDTRSNPMEELSKATGRTRASLRVTLSRLRSKLRKCITLRLQQQGGLA